MNNDQTRLKVHKLIQERNYEGAYKVLISMIKSDPDNSANHSIMGDVLVKLDDIKSAVEHYELAIHDYLKKGLPIPALTVARKILRIDESYSRAYYLMGKIYHSLDKKEQAESEYLKYLKTIPPDDADAIAIYRILSGYHPDDISWERKILEHSDPIGDILDFPVEEVDREVESENDAEPEENLTEPEVNQPADESLPSGSDEGTGPEDTASDSPKSVSYYIDSGNHLFDKGDIYDAALEYLKACIQLREEKKEDLVFDLLDSILEIYPESITAASELVRISKLQGDAIREETAFSRLAAAYVLTGNIHKAIHTLEHSLEPASYIKPDILSEILKSDAELNARRSCDSDPPANPGFKAESTVPVFDMIHDELNGKVDSIQSFYDPVICLENGVQAMDLELYEEAIDEFGKVVSNQAYRIRTKYNIALCYFYLEQLRDAESECIQGLVLCITAREKAIRYYLLLADIYEHTGRQHLAGKLKEAVFEFTADSGDTHSGSE